MDMINPDSLAQPKGYNHGIRVGSTLMVAGQVAWDRNGHLVGANDFVTQFGQALRNVIDVVQGAGGGPANLAKLTIFVTDKSQYLSCLRELGVEYRAIMGTHYPAMTLVEVKGLVEEGALMEIEGVALFE